MHGHALYISRARESPLPDEQGTIAIAKIAIAKI